MPKHAVDRIGYPLDPELRRLQFELGDLATEWRGSRDDRAHQAEIVEEYHTLLAKLSSLGWDDELDLDAELPQELMPKEYLKRNKRI